MLKRKRQSQPQVPALIPLKSQLSTCSAIKESDAVVGGGSGGGGGASISKISIKCSNILSTGPDKKEPEKSKKRATTTKATTLKETSKKVKRSPRGQTPAKKTAKESSGRSKGRDKSVKRSSKTSKKRRRHRGQCSSGKNTIAPKTPKRNFTMTSGKYSGSKKSDRSKRRNRFGSISRRSTVKR